MASTGNYATAKANLRENVKTLVGIFGGVAGVLIAGTPFSGYGALQGFTQRWVIATLGLLAAVLLVGASVWLLLRLLQPDLLYQSMLRQNAGLDDVDRADLGEISAVRREFHRHRKELLPSGVDNLDALETEADLAYRRWQVASAALVAAGAPANATAHAEAERKAFDDINDSLVAVNDWAAFVRLRHRIVRGCNQALLLGLAALCAIGSFAWAVGQKPDASDKAEAAPAAQVIVLGAAGSSARPADAAALPALNAILFETARTQLSAEGMAELGRARDFMRSHPDTGVLVFSYADTRGDAALNRRLSAGRAQVVKRSLMAEGGIGGSRIFVAELPESDLPLLTGRGVDSERNRSVQLMLIPMPVRR